MTTNENFEVKLPLFEGPFDLLLFFIERDELDIYDIPISKITSDFLEYIHHMERLDVELASEFILVAATLMRIKSKMLLPRPQLDDKGNEIDPREELVRHLLTLLALDERRIDAIRYYDHWIGLIRKELGISPLPATRAIIEEIKNLHNAENTQHLRARLIGRDEKQIFAI